MGPVLCTKFVHYVLDMKIHSILGNFKLIGYLFVLAPVTNQLQHLQLTRREVFFTQMLCEKSAHLCRHMPFAPMNGPDHCEQSAQRHAFENVTKRSRTNSTLN